MLAKIPCRCLVRRHRYTNQGKSSRSDLRCWIEHILSPTGTSTRCTLTLVRLMTMLTSVSNRFHNNGNNFWMLPYLNENKYNIQACIAFKWSEHCDLQGSIDFFLYLMSMIDAENVLYNQWRPFSLFQPFLRALRPISSVWWWVSPLTAQF